MIIISTSDLTKCSGGIDHKIVNPTFWDTPFEGKIVDMVPQYLSKDLL